MRSWWNTIKKPLELTVWAAVLVLLALRLGPQLMAIVGLGAGDEDLEVVYFRTLDGVEITAEDLKGQVVLVNAWATWCPPCVIEMPGFQRIYEDYRDEGFTVLGVSRDQAGPERVRIFLAEKGITYPIAMAGEADLGGITRVETLPTSFLVGRDGTIRHRIEGIYPGPALRLAVRRLLAEDP
jgi:thiol-disulfide isomerase/thioredoxin